MYKATEESHNRQLLMEMKVFDYLAEDATTEFIIPIYKVPLFCLKQKLSY